MRFRFLLAMPCHVPCLNVCTATHIWQTQWTKHKTICKHFINSLNGWGKMPENSSAFYYYAHRSIDTHVLLLLSFFIYFIRRKYVSFNTWQPYTLYALVLITVHLPFWCTLICCGRNWSFWEGMHHCIIIVCWKVSKCVRVCFNIYESRVKSNLVGLIEKSIHLTTSTGCCWMFWEFRKTKENKLIKKNPGGPATCFRQIVERKMRTI